MHRTGRVTDAQLAALHSHSNKAALDLVSGVNTGDQTLEGLGGVPTTRTVAGKALSSNVTIGAADLTYSEFDADRAITGVSVLRPRLDRQAGATSIDEILRGLAGQGLL